MTAGCGRSHRRRNGRRRNRCGRDNRRDRRNLDD